MNDSSSQLYSQILTASGSGGQLEALAIRKSLGAATLVAAQTTKGKWLSGRTLPSPRMELTQLTASPGFGGQLYVFGLTTSGSIYLVSTEDAQRGWVAGKALPVPATSSPFASIGTGIGSDGNFQVMGLDTGGGLWVASWQNSQTLEWDGGLSLTTPVNADIIAVGMGNNKTYLQVFGLAAGQPYLLSYQGTDGSWNQGFAISNPDSITFASIASATTSDGMLFFIGLTSTGSVAMISQSQSGAWGTPTGIGTPGPFSSIAIGTNSAGTVLIVTGLTNGGPVLVATYSNGTWTSSGSALPAPDKPFGALAVGPGDNGSIQVLGLDQNNGEPYVVAWLDQSGSPQNGFQLPEQPPPPQIMTVRVGNFSNPDSQNGESVNASTAGATAFFTGYGELGFLYPSSTARDGEPAMALRYARTRDVDLYAVEGVSLTAADVDISSGWSDSSLLSLLVGGRANQHKDALCAAMPPAVTVWDGITFLFWTSQDQDRIYGAYINQTGDFSALIELYARADVEGNGEEALTAPSTMPAPAAYTFGDCIYLIVPSSGSGKIDIHVFHPNEINYSTVDRSKEVFVNYANQGAKDQKPGHTTWVRSNHMSIPTSLLRKTSPSDAPAGKPSIKHLSACLNVALGRQAYLLLSIGYSDDSRHDRIITIDERTGLPNHLVLDERGIIVVTDGPKVDPDDPRSIATVPNSNIRSVSRAAHSREVIEVRYLDPSAFLDSHDNKVDFRKPKWVENAADPSFTTPSAARPLGGAMAQAVVYAQPYLDPNVPADTDPREVPTVLNVYSVLLSLIHPNSSTASAKPATIYMTRRLGTARQVPSEMKPVTSSNPLAGIDGVGPGTGLAVNAIMDGPLPVPNSNINQLIGAMVGASVAKVTVGTTHASSNKFTYEQYTGNGMDIEGSLTLGFSADLDVGLRILDSGVSDKITFTSSISAIAKGNFLSGATHGWNKVRTETAQSNYVSTAPLMIDPQNPNTAVIVSEDASLFGTDPTLRMIRYEFQDNSGKLVNGKLTPFTVGLGTSEQVVRVVEPLSVRPGDLESYTIERINQAMAKAYDDLSAENKRYFKASEYKDYFNNVIQKRALVLGSGKPFLELAWSNAGIYAETSDQLAQRTNTNGWDFTWETKAGIGLDFKQENEVNAGSPFLFFNTVTKSSIQFKLQTLYWHKETSKHVQESTDTNSFGLAVDFGQIRAGYLPGDVISYSMRVYLLQPSRQWTLEASLMGKKPAPGLNLTSQPWKVMYTVHDVVRIPKTTRTNR